MLIFTHRGVTLALQSQPHLRSRSSTQGSTNIHLYTPQLKALNSCILEIWETHSNPTERAESPLQLHVAMFMVSCTQVQSGHGVCSIHVPTSRNTTAIPHIDMTTHPNLPISYTTSQVREITQIISDYLSFNIVKAEYWDHSQ